MSQYISKTMKRTSDFQVYVIEVIHVFNWENPFLNQVKFFLEFFYGIGQDE